MTLFLPSFLESAMEAPNGTSDGDVNVALVGSPVDFVELVAP